jgi:hypothetical protein
MTTRAIFPRSDVTRDTLTAERLREVLHYDPDTGVSIRLISTSHYLAGEIAGRINQTGYRDIMIDGKRYRASRLAFLYMTGNMVDHRNMIRADDRWSNLRCATRSQNMANRLAQSNNTSGLKGAKFCKKTGKWEAQIGVRGQKRWLGYYTTKEEAHAAYCAAANKEFDEFARVR